MSFKAASFAMAATIFSISVPAVPAHAARNIASVLAELDRGFVCPQFLPNDEARRADMQTFSRAIASVGPKRLTYRQAAYIRAKMLDRHNCSSSNDVLASVAAAGSQPVGAGN